MAVAENAHKFFHYAIPTDMARDIIHSRLQIDLHVTATVWRSTGELRFLWSLSLHRYSERIDIRALAHVCCVTSITRFGHIQPVASPSNLVRGSFDQYMMAPRHMGHVASMPCPADFWTQSITHARWKVCVQTSTATSSSSSSNSVRQMGHSGGPSSSPSSSLFSSSSSSCSPPSASSAAPPPCIASSPRAPTCFCFPPLPPLPFLPFLPFLPLPLLPCLRLRPFVLS